MADFDATRLEDAKQLALGYLNDPGRSALPRAHDLARVIELQELQLKRLREQLVEARKFARGFEDVLHVLATAPCPSPVQWTKLAHKAMELHTELQARRDAAT